jgi:hypothetical protein
MLLGFPATDFLTFVAVSRLPCRQCSDTPRGAVLVNLGALTVSSSVWMPLLRDLFRLVHRARHRPLPFVIVTCSARGLSSANNVHAEGPAGESGAPSEP